MPYHSKARKHADLLDRAACRVGVDLQEQAITGALPFDGIADAVLRCMQCAEPDQCARWLEAASDRGSAPPVYCQNAALLKTLQEVVQ